MNENECVRECVSSEGDAWGRAVASVVSVRSSVSCGVFVVASSSSSSRCAREWVDSIQFNSLIPFRQSQRQRRPNPIPIPIPSARAERYDAGRWVDDVLDGVRVRVRDGERWGRGTRDAETGAARASRARGARKD